MFTFQWPLLIILLPLPFIARRYWFSTTRQPINNSPNIHFPHLAGLRTAYSQKESLSRNKKKLFPWLLFLTWSFLVFAIMQPQIIDQLNNVKNRSHDLMLAVDLSASMQSLDLGVGGKRISRIDVAKNVVKDFVTKRAGDRVGLILFGARAYLQTPLTLDTQAVSKMLDNSLAGMAGDATAIGDAIGLAVKNLRDIPSNSKAIILLTDGEDNSSTIPPLQAARLAKQYGIRIYTIVIGKDGIVPIPDDQGNIVMAESHVDTTLTKKIADLTGGEFYRAIDLQSLIKIYDQIDTLEKSESDIQHTLIRRPLYQYPMALGLLLIGLLALAAQIRRDSYEPI